MPKKKSRKALLLLAAERVETEGELSVEQPARRRWREVSPSNKRVYTTLGILDLIADEEGGALPHDGSTASVVNCVIDTYKFTRQKLDGLRRTGIKHSPTERAARVAKAFRDAAA